MSTPESSKLIRSANNISGGIRKTLLTPCRRIGLSKNKKTPNNTSFISPLGTKEVKVANDTSFHNAQVNEISSKNSSTTPLKIERAQEQVGSIAGGVFNTKLVNVKEHLNVNVKILKENKKNIKKCKNNSIDNFSENKKTRGCKENYIDAQNVIKNDRLDVSGSQIDKNVTGNNPNETRQNKTKTKRKKIIVESDEEEDSFTGFPSSGSSMETSQKEIVDEKFEIKKRKRINVISSQDSDESVYKLEDNKNRVQDNLLTNISLNESTEQSKITQNNRNCNNQNILECTENENKIIRDNYSDIDLLKKNNPGVNDEKSGRNENIKSTNSTDIENILLNKRKAKPRKEKTVKRKLSLKKTISHSDSCNDEVFPSTPKEASENPLYEMDDAQIIEEIITIERTVHNKEMQLQKLQQAEIYRNLHNLGDLKSETNSWKVGCEEALRDLLKHLNEHSSIDMNTLLTNLKVPPLLFQYDAESDNFLP